MKNLIRKDCIIAQRTALWLLLLATVILIVLPQILLKEVADAFVNLSDLNAMFKNLNVLFPMASISVASTIVFVQNITEERKQGVPQVLLANGVTAPKIWRSKILVTLGLGEVVNLVTTGGSIVLIRVLYGFWINFTATDLIRMFIFVPLLAITFSAVLCLAIWVLRQGQLVTGVMPYFAFFLCIFLSMFQVNVWEKISPISACLVLGCALIFLCIELIVSLISREYVCNLSL